MKNFVIINGVNSNTINGLGINELPPISKPSMRVLTEEIDGRDGDITTNLGYSAYDKTITIGLFGTGYDINDIISFFNGEGTIVFSNEDDKYYKYKIINQIDYEALQKFKQATITFHCQPFKYPLTETPLEIEYDYIEQTGETLTLNNTGESILDLSLKGNTSQYSTTGKNLIPYDLASIKSSNTNGTWSGNKYTYNGITYEFFEDGSFKATGSSSSSDAYVIIVPNKSYNGTFTLSSGLGINANFYVSALDRLDGYKKVMRTDNGTITATINTSLQIIAYVKANQSNVNVLFQPMIRLSTITDNTWEPYTNGASPNPSYPQPINVVTGDNEVVVCGKNIIDNTIASASQEGTGEWTYLPAGTYYAKRFRHPDISADTHNSRLQIIVNGTLTNIVQNATIDNGDISISGTDFGWYSTGATATLVLKKGYNIRITGLDYFDMIVQKTNDITSYEPYQSQTYPINLPVENLFEPTLTSEGQTIVKANATITLDDDEFTFVATGSDMYLGQIRATGDSYVAERGVLIDIGNATSISFLVTNELFKQNFITCFNSSKVSLGYYQITDYKGTQVLPSGTRYVTFRFGNANAVSGTTYKTKVQLEVGSKVNSYTPYGTTPMELCKIGDYQDYFTKNSGKNLLDISDITTGGGITNNGDSITLNGNITSTSYSLTTPFTLKANTTYCLSITNKLSSSSGSFILRNGDTNKVSLPFDTANQYVTYTPTQDEVIDTLRIFNSGVTFNNYTFSVQLEESSSPSMFEPYGTGQWCKYNAIGKVVLDGSESWNVDGDYYFTTTPGLILKYYHFAYCNYAKYKKKNDATPTTEFILTESGGGAFEFSKYTFADANALKTWLTTHNAIVYYVLATPYLSLIEDTTLINQLDNIQNAMSYEGQTNVMQVNDDKPFIIDAKALEQGSDEVVVNNIGNATSKPLIALEGTGNINIYLDGTQVLQANVVDKMNIDIDKLEAYNPDTSALLNRQVTGNYNSMTIPSGNSTIKIDGNLTSATITNYTRWL